MTERPGGRPRGGDKPADDHTANAPPPATADPVFAPNQWFLSLAQLFSGIGIAAGIAVGGLLAEDLTGTTEFAGLTQTASILGAGILAIPLAQLARQRSRRVALTAGFASAAVGAVVVILATATGTPAAFFLGMLLFGAATATGLQARYAATDAASPERKGRAMSVVVWATTVGSVAGPNLSEPGARLGSELGLNSLVGPFVISVVVFVVACMCTMRLRRPRTQPVDRTEGTQQDVEHAAEAASEDSVAARTGEPRARSGLTAGLRCAFGSPRALMGLLTVVTGHMMMVSVMVMTPVHMHHHGLALHLVGIVISLHILGMYGLSPLFGWLTDLWGPGKVIALGHLVFAAAIVFGILDAVGGSDTARISVALTLLGLGWSACLIGGSTLLAQAVPARHQHSVQGGTDALMNFGAAGVASVAGPVLAAGGFVWINSIAGLVLVLAVLFALRARYAWTMVPGGERTGAQS